MRTDEKRARVFLKHVQLLAVVVILFLLSGVGFGAATPRGGRTASKIQAGSHSESRDISEDTSDPASDEPGRVEQAERTVEPDPVVDREVVGPRPRIKVENSPFNAGSLAPNMAFQMVYPVRNTGDSPLIIFRVQTCCGTEAHLKEMELAPGESTELSITYRGRHIPGEFQKVISLYTNDPLSPKFDVTAKGRVVETMRWSPTRIELFPDQKNAGCPPIEIHAVDGGTFHIKQIQVSQSCMSLAFDPNQVFNKYTVDPVVDLVGSRVKPGTKGKILFTLDRPDYPEISIPFEVVPAIEAIPARIYVFNAVPGKVYRRSVKLRPRTASINVADLELESHHSELATTEVVGHAVDGGFYNVEFEITAPPLTEGSPRQNETLTLKLKGLGEIHLPINVVYSKTRSTRSQRPAESSRRR